MNKLNQLLTAAGSWLIRSLKWVGFLVIYLADSLILQAATSKASHPQVATRLIGIMLIYSAFLLAFLTWRYWQQLKKNNPRTLARPVHGQTLVAIGWPLCPDAGIQFGWTFLITPTS